MQWSKMPDRIAQFEHLVAQQPDNELFRFSLAQALITKHRGPEAESHLWLCVQKKSDWMLPRILLGKQLLATNRQAEAKAVLEEALRLAIDQDHDDPAEELRSILSQL
jgi:predicted Zn-dependent protease